ncbi:MAG: hypothetical protein ACJAZN_002395 [Planctomycetota bacterium]|jgi:uncharacterized protein (DUF885 family)
MVPMLTTALVLAASLASPLQSAGPTVGTTPSQTAADQLTAVCDEVWQHRLDHNPLLASSVGDPRGHGRLPDVSPAAQAALSAYAADVITKLEAIPAADLTGRDRVTRAMLLAELQDTRLSIQFKEYELPLNADSGFHTSFARLPDETTFETESDVIGYLERMEAFPAYVDAQIANMKAGQARGFVLPRVVMLGLESTLVPYLVEPESHPFFLRIDALPESIYSATDGNNTHGNTDDTAKKLRARALRAVENGVTRGYRTFHEFLTNTYIPNGRDTLGASSLPNGPEYYDYLVRRFTTLDQGAQAVHDKGLAEVARIRADMEAVVTHLEFKGTFAEFLAFLRTDEQFYARSPEELLGRAARICKDVDGKLPRYFNRLPRQPYGVEPVPLAIAPKYTSGRYVPAPLTSNRAGTYWVNTYDLKSRPLYALPALSLHEAVPGHHLQIALNAELESLPPFRKDSSITAYVEGWALYTEWLGIEMGMYTTPYEEFGRLTYEMWRACRLVVDTGLHQFGWKRQQAIDYLASNTALSIHECTTEVDRYISWPGQALAYKTGEIEIRKLRVEAETRLGPAFRIADFHAAVLEEGTVPLKVLRENVEAWITAGESK